MSEQKNVNVNNIENIVENNNVENNGVENIINNISKNDNDNNNMNDTDDTIDIGNTNNIKENNNDFFKSDILNLKKTVTLNRLTKYEKARIIGTRASQIQNGMSPVFLKDGKHIEIPEEFKDTVKDSIGMAKLELMLKSTPLIIKRRLPSGKVKEKTIQELN